MAGSLDMFPDAAIRHIIDASDAERELQIQGDPEGVLRRTLTDARADFEEATRCLCKPNCEGCPLD